MVYVFGDSIMSYDREITEVTLEEIVKVLKNIEASLYCIAGHFEDQSIYVNVRDASKER